MILSMRALLVAGCPCVVTAIAAAQPKPRPVGIIDGIVTDSNLIALGQANVSVLGSTLKVETGDDGRFRVLQVPAGEYILIVRRLGFHPASSVVEVRDNDVTRLTFTLERLIPTLDTTRIVEHYVSPRLTDYESRRRSSVGGQYITATDIARRGSAYLADHL